jgi:hypothetical protein
VTLLVRRKLSLTSGRPFQVAQAEVTRTDVRRSHQRVSPSPFGRHDTGLAIQRLMSDSMQDRALDADPDLGWERAFGDLAVDGGPGQHGPRKDGFQADETVLGLPSKPPHSST